MLRALSFIVFLLVARTAHAQIHLRSDRSTALTSLRAGTSQIDSFMLGDQVKRYVAKGIQWTNRNATVTVDFDSVGLVRRWSIACEGVDSNTFIRTYAKDFNSSKCRESSRNKAFIYGLLVYPPHDLHVLYNIADRVLQLEYLMPGERTSFRFSKSPDE